MYLIAVFNNPRALAYIADDIARKYKGIATRKDVMNLTQLLADHTYKIRGAFALKLHCESVPFSIKTSAVATYKVENYELLAIEEPNAVYRAIAEEARLPTYNYLTMFHKDAVKK